MIAIEILGIEIRNPQNISGLKFDTTTKCIKILQIESKGGNIRNENESQFRQ